VVRLLHGQDVWSFGVVLWEIFTDGAEPFEELSPELAAREVMEGRRLTIPPSTPARVARLIEQCWAKEREERPSFHEICVALECILLKGPDKGPLLPPLFRSFSSPTRFAFVLCFVLWRVATRPTSAPKVDRRPRRSTPERREATKPEDEETDEAKLKALEAKLPDSVLARPRRRKTTVMEGVDVKDFELGGSGGSSSTELSPVASREDNSVASATTINVTEEEDSDSDDDRSEDFVEGDDDDEVPPLVDDEDDEYGGQHYKLMMPKADGSY